MPRTRSYTLGLMILKRHLIVYQERLFGEAMRNVSLEEWIVQFVQALYHNNRSKVRVGDTFIDYVGMDMLEGARPG